MHLYKLLLKDFGQFHNKEIELAPGINICNVTTEADEDALGDFVEASIYGIDRSFEAGDRPDLLERSRPDEGGFSGKAYINRGSDRILVEHNFQPKSRKMSVLDLSSGRELTTAERFSLYKTVTDLDKYTYRDALRISAELPGEGGPAAVRDYVVHMATTGATRFDKDAAIAALEKRKSTFTSEGIDRRIASLEAEIATYADCEEQLATIREQIKETEDEFAMETARRKREARKLIDTKSGEVKYKDNKELNENLDALAEQRVFLDPELLNEYKPPKKLTDKIWFILLTGLFVIGVITLMVMLLPFEKDVREIFIFCTILFVIVTIVNGLYEKGIFDGDVYTPTEEEFKQILYDLERKNEAFEDVEIDMSFAKEFLDRKSKLRTEENELLVKYDRMVKLQEELAQARDDKNNSIGEVTAVNLAINTIRELSDARTTANRYLINHRISDMLTDLTHGKYIDARITNDERLLLRTAAGSAIDIMKAPAEDLLPVYLAIRFTIAKELIKDRMPIVIDRVSNLGEEELMALVRITSKIDTDQIILIARDDSVGDTFTNEHIPFQPVVL